MNILRDGEFPPLTVNAAADGILFKGRCVLLDAAIVATSDTATAAIYDGISTGGTLKKKLSAATLTSDGWWPTGGCLFESGIYVDLGGTAPSFTANILPLKDVAT
jgi:hypothetical protein